MRRWVSKVSIIIILLIIGIFIVNENRFRWHPPRTNLEWEYEARQKPINSRNVVLRECQFEDALMNNHCPIIEDPINIFTFYYTSLNYKNGENVSGKYLINRLKDETAQQGANLVLMECGTTGETIISPDKYFLKDVYRCGGEIHFIK